MPERIPRSLVISAFVLMMQVDGSAQTGQDSLWRIWSNTDLPDTTRLRALGRFAWQGYLFSQPDSAYYYGQMMYDHAAKKGLKEQMAWALRGQGVSFSVKAEHAKALDYWLRSMELSQSVNDLVGVAGSLNNIGILYFDQGDYPKALEYHQRSLLIRQRSGDRKGAAASLNSIAEIYEMKGDHEQALSYTKQGFDLFGKVGSEHGQAFSLLEMGRIHNDMGNAALAVQDLEQSLKLFERTNDRMEVAETMNLLGTIRLEQGDLQEALRYCEGGTRVAEELRNISEQQKGCKCLYKLHKAMGHRQEALEQLERANILDDSLKLQEIDKKLQRMEFNKQLRADSLEKVREEQHVQLMHKAEMVQETNRKNIYLFSSIGVLLAAVGLWSRLRYVRRSRAAIQQEKDVSEALLLNILPHEVAEELKAKGSAEARLIDHATVLFTDFKGFTAYSEKLSPQQLVHDLNECFTAFDNIILKNGMEKIKTIGDAYMAAGGLPVANETHAIDVVRAAFEIRDFIAEGKARKIAAGLPYFEIRIGIHTGPVVAGIVGLRKFSYDIWGDTVNIASRMESSGEVGQVNISESTYALVKDAPGLSFTPRGQMEAKGKGMLGMYFVHRTTTAA
jgi:class 3 adenylate cyclase